MLMPTMNGRKKQVLKNGRTKAVGPGENSQQVADHQDGEGDDRGVLEREIDGVDEG